MQELILATLSLLVIVDPVLNATIFIDLTYDWNVRERRIAFLKASILAYLILVLTALIGREVLVILGLRIEAFKIAGGALLMLIAAREVLGEISEVRITERERRHEYPEDIYAFPMATPLLAGPGAITTVIILRDYLDRFSVLIAITLTMLITALLLDISARVGKLLGDDAMRVLKRLLGLIIAAIAAHFIVDGLIGYSRILGQTL